jgi:uncharacterized delta-60 repeat protein
MRVAFLAVLLTVLVVAPRALAAAGDLDPSFGTGGKTVFGVGERQQANAVALQPDGKIVVAGTRVNVGSSDFAIVRLTPLGALDTSYGSGTGWSFADLGGDDYGNAVAIESGGKILAAGRSNASGSYGFAAARVVPPAGTLDPSFGGSATGKAFVDFGGSNGDLTAAVLQPDGKFVLAGSTNKNGDNDFAVARLQGDGTIDGSFGITGMSVGGFSPGSQDIGDGVALQPDGRIVQVGFTKVAGRFDFAVDRLSVPDGNFDNSFGSGGTVLVDFGSDSFASADAIQPDGKIVVVGNSGPNATQDFAVTRLLANGNVDGSFGGSGRVLIDAGGDDFGHDVALQPDGKIVVAGNFGDDAGVARLNADGTLDTSFGSGGKARVDFGGQDQAAALALQPDGKLVVVGSTRTGSVTDIAAARLEGAAGAPGGGGGGGAGGGGGPAVLSRLAIRPRAFPAASRGATITRRKRKTGTRISYTDSLAAVTTFKVFRRKRVRCGRKRCTRFKSVGGFKHADVAGRDSFHFTGRVRGRKLRPGSYRLRAVPSVAGVRGAAVTTAFRIVK